MAPAADAEPDADAAAKPKLPSIPSFKPEPPKVPKLSFGDINQNPNKMMNLANGMKRFGKRVEKFKDVRDDRTRMLELDLAAEELKAKFVPYETEVLSQRRVLSTRDTGEREKVREMARQPREVMRSALEVSRLLKKQKSLALPAIQSARGYDRRDAAERDSKGAGTARPVPSWRTDDDVWDGRMVPWRMRGKLKYTMAFIHGMQLEDRKPMKAMAFIRRGMDEDGNPRPPPPRMMNGGNPNDRDQMEQDWRERQLENPDGSGQWQTPSHFRLARPPPKRRAGR